MMLSWLIVGGGPHGVHIAVGLVTAGVRPQDLAIVDPNAKLLDNWTACTRRTGMSHLRSPSVHHLDIDPWSLRDFAAGWKRDQLCDEPFRAPYSRPALPLFQAHCQSVIARYGLQERLEQAAVEAIHPQRDTSVALETTRDGLRARRVVLALGSGGTEAWPSWAKAIRDTRPDRIQHVFDPGFDLDQRERLSSVAVIGGGITGVQLALRLSRLGKRVTLVSRHRLRRQQFDSDPTWLGPSKMKPFLRTKNPAQRRRAINAARHRGSMPAELHREFRAALRKHEVRLLHCDIQGCIGLRDAVVLRCGSSSLEVDAIALATGFNGTVGTNLLAKLRPQSGFPRAACGTPLVDSHLHWHANIYCAGALAELELGPVARNLAGARRAAERISPVAMRA